MKITIETEEHDDALLAIHGREFWGALWEIDQQCRGQLKYGNQFQNADAALEWVRDQIREELDSRGISLDIVS